MYKSLDYRCCIIYFGLEEFAGALPQPYQRMVGQCHVCEHRQRASDHDRNKRSPMVAPPAAALMSIRNTIAAASAALTAI